MKYVIFGGLSAGVMLYGISLLYGLTGTIYQVTGVLGPPLGGWLAGVGISIMSYRGMATLAVIADAKRVPDPEWITAQFGREFDAMLRSAHQLKGDAAAARVEAQRLYRLRLEGPDAACAGNRRTGTAATGRAGIAGRQQCHQFRFRADRAGRSGAGRGRDGRGRCGGGHCGDRRVVAEDIQRRRRGDGCHL